MKNINPSCSPQVQKSQCTHKRIERQGKSARPSDSADRPHRLSSDVRCRHVLHLPWYPIPLFGGRLSCRASLQCPIAISWPPAQAYGSEPRPSVPVAVAMGR